MDELCICLGYRCRVTDEDEKVKGWSVLATWKKVRGEEREEKGGRARNNRKPGDVMSPGTKGGTRL